jgi:hypothetical protein
VQDTGNGIKLDFVRQNAGVTDTLTAEIGSQATGGLWPLVLTLSQSLVTSNQGRANVTVRFVITRIFQRLGDGSTVQPQDFKGWGQPSVVSISDSLGNPVKQVTFVSTDPAGIAVTTLAGGKGATVNGTVVRPSSLKFGISASLPPSQWAATDAQLCLAGFVDVGAGFTVVISDPNLSADQVVLLVQSATGASIGFVAINKFAMLGSTQVVVESSVTQSSSQPGHWAVSVCFLTPIPDYIVLDPVVQFNSESYLADSAKNNEQTTSAAGALFVSLLCLLVACGLALLL